MFWLKKFWDCKSFCGVWRLDKLLNLQDSFMYIHLLWIYKIFSYELIRNKKNFQRRKKMHIVFRARSHKKISDSCKSRCLLISIHVNFFKRKLTNLWITTFRPTTYTILDKIVMTNSIHLFKERKVLLLGHDSKLTNDSININNIQKN